jgi:hypothetical protein
MSDKIRYTVVSFTALQLHRQYNIAYEIGKLFSGTTFVHDKYKPGCTDEFHNSDCAWNKLHPWAFCDGITEP